MGILLLIIILIVYLEWNMGFNGPQIRNTKLEKRLSLSAEVLKNIIYQRVASVVQS